MPLYEYLCQDCEQQSELLVRFERSQLARNVAAGG